jgi:FtsP/CotA-like multicopper oxidase with cupredoxin domain
MRCRRLSRISCALAILIICSPRAFPADSLPLIHSNQNHTPAGVLQGGILTIQLEIAKGNWHPEAEDGIALSVYAFGEAGKPLQNPGPLIRVPQGTEIRTSLHNSLSVPVAVHGFGDPLAENASVHVAPGAIEQVRFKATNPGLYFYWGTTEGDDLKLRHGVDSELTGAFVVDPAGANTNEEIFVIEMISEHAGLASRETLATINGKSWPYTQRFQYDMGQPVRWRWINATNEPHALPCTASTSLSMLSIAAAGWRPTQGSHALLS